MHIESAILLHLQSDSTLIAYLENDSDIFLGSGLQGRSGNCVMVMPVSQIEYTDIYGSIGAAQTRIQVSCFSTDPQTALDMADRVRTLLHAKTDFTVFASGLGTMNIYTCHLLNKLMLTLPKEGGSQDSWHNVVTDYRVRYQTSVSNTRNP